MAFPNFKLEAAFATADPFAAAPVYTDISTRLKSVQWGHERQRELDAVSTGMSQIEVDNSDRAFELMYASSPYYPNVRPDVRVRLSVSLGGGAYQPLFVHYIDDVVPAWSNINDDTAILMCQDAFSTLQLIDLQGIFSQQDVGARFNAVLTLIGWPTADRNIASGGTTLPQKTFVSADNATALSFLQLCSDSRPGSFYVDKAGKIVSSGFGTPAGVLPSTLGLGGVDITVAQPRAPRSLCFNVMKFNCSAPALFNNPATDTASIAKHRRRVLSKSVLAMSQSAIDGIAGQYLARYKWPVETFDQIGVTAANDAGYALLAAVDIGSVGTLARRSEVGTDYSQPVIVNAFSHRVSIGDGIWEGTLRATARQVV